MAPEFFLNPTDPMQRRYEALRASVVEGLSAHEVANKFGYSVHTVNALRRDFKAGSLQPFFLPLARGPKSPRPATAECKERIIALRKQNYSIGEIEEVLLREGQTISEKTIHLLLQAEGFARLFRRTRAERREALQRAKVPAEVADASTFGAHRLVRTSFGGVFLFLPLIMELHLDSIFATSGLYGSKQIPAINYLMSFMALKLIGKERLSHVTDLNFDYGLGAFAGLNVLPKVTALTQYSYRNPHHLVVRVLKKWNVVLKDRDYLQGRHINLDFHSIPHWGEESQLDNHWVATRGKRMKSVLSFFAQDLDTTYLCYANGQLAKEDASDEILQFLRFYRNTHKKLPECLVFDAKLTSYKNLNTLDKEFGINFITLRRRNKKLLQQIETIKTWERITIKKSSRKHQVLKIHQGSAKIKEYEGRVRQIIVSGTGRDIPMLIITNMFGVYAKDIIETYALRWLLENNIQENIDFFNLNTLSSPVIVKVDFDIALTMIANTLYKILSSKLKLFGNAKPKTTYRSIVEGDAKIRISAEKVHVTFGKKAYNPMIMDWVGSMPPVQIPWMGNRTLEYSLA
jgi:transposase